MKRIVLIGIVAAAGPLFFWAMPAFAQQDDQPVKQHRAAAQTTPGAPVGSSLPNGRVQRGPLGSPRFGPQSRPYAQPFSPASRSMSPSFERVPNREMPAARSVHRVPREQLPRTSATSTSKKKNTSATRAERADHPDNGEHGSHQTTSAHGEAERAAPTPARTPAAQATPTRAPEVVPMMVPNAPPMVSAPAEHVLQPAAPPQAQVQPHAQRPPPLNDLSEDERARLHSAHLNALHDPNLAASRARYLDARKEFRQKLRDALLKADPSVQPILEKIRKDKPDDH